MLALVVVFMAGRWTGRLQSSLAAEAGYPRDLYQKIASMNVTCDAFAEARRTGQALVETMDGGSKVGVAFYSASEQRVTVSVVDDSGRYATDSWSLACR
jgi:hypothetical protein